MRERVRNKHDKNLKLKPKRSSFKEKRLFFFDNSMRRMEKNDVLCMSMRMDGWMDSQRSDSHVHSSFSYTSLLYI